MAHRISKSLAWFSCGVALLGGSASAVHFDQRTKLTRRAACELLRTMQEIIRLQDRATAQARGLEAAYDAQYGSCSYLIPSTDAGYHPGGFVFAPFWHIVKCVRPV
jgi:hypothetical protein